MAVTRGRRAAAKKTPAKKAPAKKVSREPTKAQVNLLERCAREINVRLEKAEGMDDKATDHRLAAALKLAEAKETCKEAGVGFKKWCEDNVEWSYETARKLVRIGADSDPEAALEDMRNKTAIQMRESRERQAKAKTATKAIAGPTGAPAKVVKEALASMSETQAVKAITQAAKAHGVEIGGGDVGDLGELRHAVAAYDALSATDKLHLLAHAAVDTGADIKIFDEDIEDAAAAAAEKAEKPKKAAPSRRRRTNSRAAA